MSGLLDKIGIAIRLNDILKNKFKKLNEQFFKISLLYEFEVDLKIDLKFDL